MTTGWNALISVLPGAHVLQTSEWGQVKAHNGWQPHHLVWLRGHGEPPDKAEIVRIREGGIQAIDIVPDRLAAAALLLVRGAGLPVSMSVAYSPKGPLLDWADADLRRQVLGDLAAEARRESAIMLKIDPDVRIGTGLPGTPEAVPDDVGEAVARDLEAAGWGASKEQVQFKNTVEIDLAPPLEAILASFKQKTRYNIRLAERRGVAVRPGDRGDIEALYRMYMQTSVRDGFTVRDLDYYKVAWGTFLRGNREHGDPGAQARRSIPTALPLIAEVDGRAIAAVIPYHFAGKAWFLFGMSGDEHREKMPNHRLQWEAIIRAKESGCARYDLWGAPDQFEPADPLWGVYRFKEGFRGEVIRYIGAWDLPIRPAAYTLYTRIMPRVLDLMRGRGNRRVLRESA